MVLYANSSRAYFVSGASEGSAAAAASSDGDGDDTNTNIEAAIAVNFTNVKTCVRRVVPLFGFFLSFSFGCVCPTFRCVCVCCVSVC